MFRSLATLALAIVPIAGGSQPPPQPADRTVQAGAPSDRERVRGTSLTEVARVRDPDGGRQLAAFVRRRGERLCVFVGRAGRPATGSEAALCATRKRLVRRSLLVAVRHPDGGVTSETEPPDPPRPFVVVGIALDRRTVRLNSPNNAPLRLTPTREGVFLAAASSEMIGGFGVETTRGGRTVRRHGAFGPLPQ
jgi:hypothetical protein